MSTARRRGWVLLCTVALSGCRKKPPPPPVEPPPVPVSSVKAPVASAAPPAPVPALAPVQATIGWRALAEAKECGTKERDLDPNLAFGTLGIAARGKDLGVALHYVTRVKGEGLLAFAGYNSLTQTLAVGHGLGKAGMSPAKVFPRKNDFVVAWFDALGLSFTKTSWAANLPDVERLPAVTPAEAGHTAILQLPDGGFLVAVPLTPGTSEQISLFRFDLSGDGPSSVKALGVTRKASGPDHAAMAAVGDSFLVAWDDLPAKEKPRVIAITHFDAQGKEGDAIETLSSPDHAATQPVMASGERGAVVAWTEGEGEATSVVVRAVDEHGKIAGPATRIASGQLPVLSATKEGYVLSLLKRGDASAPPQVATVHLDAAGRPAAGGYLVSELGKGKGAVAGAPASAVTEDGRAAIGFVYSDGMRSHLVSVKVDGCLATGGAGSAPPASSASASSSASAASSAPAAASAPPAGSASATVH